MCKHILELIQFNHIKKCAFLILNDEYLQKFDKDKDLDKKYI
jgi:hypothetical protein